MLKWVSVHTHINRHKQHTNTDTNAHHNHTYTTTLTDTPMMILGFYKMGSKDPLRLKKGGPKLR